MKENFRIIELPDDGSRVMVEKGWMASIDKQIPVLTIIFDINGKEIKEILTFETEMIRNISFEIIDSSVVRKIINIWKDLHNESGYQNQ